LVDEITVGTMELNAVETDVLGPLGGDPELFDDVECPMRRTGTPPSFVNATMSNGTTEGKKGYPAGHVDMALPATMNELHEHATALSMDGVRDGLPSAFPRPM
jgi:hypothetical protein